MGNVGINIQTLPKNRFTLIVRLTPVTIEQHASSERADNAYYAGGERNLSWLKIDAGNQEAKAIL